MAPASALLQALRAGGTHEVLRMGSDALSADQLLGSAAAVIPALGDARRVAVWMAPTPAAVAGLVAGLLAGREMVPLNPGAAPPELEHVLGDCRPDLVLAADADVLPPLRWPPRLAVGLRPPGRHLAPPGVPGDATALVLYTSGTTGPPKGVVLSHAAISANLDALADAWAWTAADTVVHCLPLFHAHGLVLGTLGPLHLGGRSHHVGQFDPPTIAAALGSGGTMLFAVPTMYHRLADAAARDPRVTAGLRRARLLVSGSAPLSIDDHGRIRELTGQEIVERYGLTETLMICAVRADGPRRPGFVGPPLPGVEVRLMDESAGQVAGSGPGAIGEVVVRGPSLFSGYLGRPDDTAAALRDGWMSTGDAGFFDPDGTLRLLGRLSLDLVKTGGYRVGTGEVEAALASHPAVAEVAVAGEPDPDLGQRLVAWVVCREGQRAVAADLLAHAGANLARHKVPRRVVFVDALPRNALGKVLKRELLSAPT